MATFTPDKSNTIFQLASSLINETARNIFLTGKAGTGKTTFLRYIRESCAKQMAILAPTGVAAINAGGVTLHSFFQLPLSPFIPTLQRTGFNTGGQETNNRHSLISRLRYNKEKRKLLYQLELLVIDEISMVRCDLLDAVDTILRHFRKKPLEPFGGVQVLFIGDMFQLPPVVKETDWQLLSPHYESPYFFSSQVLKDNPPLYIEFDKIYRQSEEKFIRVLNQVRNNELDKDGLSILESRFQPSFRRKKDDGYIILTTHNEQARNINHAALQDLPGNARRYEAEIKNDFPENAYPAEEVLVLKPGAQVMFIKNDGADKGKRFFNGKIGTITSLEESTVYVQCPDETDEIEVKRESWDNIRYTIEKTSQNMKEELLGSFSQFPLRLAWAITIHKSQGLTFDKAIIDAGEAFAPGQVYVALSRCTSLEGLVLKSRIRAGNLHSDPRIIQFSKTMASSARLQQELESAKKQYHERLVLSCFDYKHCIDTCRELMEYLSEHESSFNSETIPWLKLVQDKINILQDTAVKFQHWLNEQFTSLIPHDENKVLQERTKRAAAHFIKEARVVIEELGKSPAITDSRQHTKEYNDSLRDLFAQLSSNTHTLQVLEAGFQPALLPQQRKDFVLPSFTVNAYAGSSEGKIISPHPVLHKQLRDLRNAICARKDQPVYLVAGSATIDEMARYLPQSLEELRKISGFGDARIAQYGQEFLDIITQYCGERNLCSLIHEKTPKRERKEKSSPSLKTKGQTYAVSYKLYKEGRTITEIAKERALAISTIEGHLTRYIHSGEINIYDLVSREKYLLIEAALENFDGTTTVPVKEKLPVDISFGEIKMVMAALGIRQHKKDDAPF